METTEQTIEDKLRLITEFGDQAHGEQLRKYSPDRYMVHPVRVMEMLKEYTTRLDILAAALLHDVIEDTPVNKDEIFEFLTGLMSYGMAQRTVKLVEELTDVYVKEDYPHLNRDQRKAKENMRMQKTSAEAQSIKYADIIDNTTDIVQHDPHFAKRYLREARELLRLINKGEKQLYKKAKEVTGYYQ